jgi:hypothetical protein
MAIAPSYPMGTPKLTDTVIGVQYEEMKDPAVKNFNINDIAALVPAQPAQLPYKVYTALISQTGINAPTVIVLENTLEDPGSFSYQTVGIFNYTNVGAFTLDKTIVFCTKDANEETPAYIIEGKRTSDDTVQFIVKATTTNNLTNGALSKANIEIRVYN